MNAIFAQTLLASLIVAAMVNIRFWNDTMKRSQRSLFETIGLILMTFLIGREASAFVLGVTVLFIIAAVVVPLKIAKSKAKDQQGG